MHERLRTHRRLHWVSFGLLLLLAACPVTERLETQTVRERARLTESRGARHFPLGIGFRWVYLVQGVGESHTREVRVLMPENPSDRAGFPIQGYLGGLQATHLIKSGDDSSIVETGAGGVEYLWYRFGAEVGESWVMRIGPGGSADCEDGVTLTMAAKDEVVSVPAGEFRDVIRIDRQRLLCADAGIVSEWFAPGVGLIRRVEESIAGPVTSELTEAHLGDQHWPASRYEASLEPSAHTYVK